MYGLEAQLGGDMLIACLIVDTAKRGEHELHGPNAIRNLDHGPLLIDGEGAFPCR
jgi:hypothetical protein